VALAAALAGKLDLAGRTTGIVLSGGNVDPELYGSILSGAL
jgi:threonine dehydratase